MTTPPTPANWYPDPEDPNGLRYWDGTTWTEHRAPAVTPQAPTETPAEAPAAEAPAAEPSSDPFAGSEQATSIVKLPEQAPSGFDQATSVITTRPSADPDEPKKGAHRAPDEGAASAPETAPYEPSQPSWGATPPAAPYESTQLAPTSYGAPPTQAYDPSQGQPSYGAPGSASSFGAPPPSYPPGFQPQDQPPGGPPPAGNKKVLFGVIGGLAALILVVALVLVYFFVIKDDGTSTTAASSSSSSSRASSSSSKATTTSARPTMTSPTEAPPGPNPTIADYIAQNGIQETPIQPDDPTAPPINIPIPTGWENVSGDELPTNIYGGAIYLGPELADDPPQIQALYVRLVGNVDPAQLLALAPGELNNFPGYTPQDPGAEGTLSGFPAYQLAGTYDGAGGRRLIAQKTAVIPADDGATYVLQLNVEGPEAANDVMITATGEIDQGTTIG